MTREDVIKIADTAFGGGQVKLNYDYLHLNFPFGGLAEYIARTLSDEFTCTEEGMTNSQICLRMYDAMQMESARLAGVAAAFAEAAGKNES